MKNDKTKIRSSLREERQAVKDYGKRAAKAKSPALAKTIRHIQGEEKHHIQLLKAKKRKR